MSPVDATYHVAQDLVYALQNTEPARPLVKLGNEYKHALNTLAEIFITANPPAVLPMVTVRGVRQKKFQGVNQEGTQMKREQQSNSFTNEESLRLSIVEAYPDELQPVNK